MNGFSNHVETGHLENPFMTHIDRPNFTNSFNSIIFKSGDGIFSLRSIFTLLGICESPKGVGC